VIEALSIFFKLPQVADETTMKPVHALHAQETMLNEWLSEQKETASEVATKSAQ